MGPIAHNRLRVVDGDLKHVLPGRPIAASKRGLIVSANYQCLGGAG